jgi:hypothetical protein
MCALFCIINLAIVSSLVVTVDKRGLWVPFLMRTVRKRRFVGRGHVYEKKGSWRAVFLIHTVVLWHVCGFHAGKLVADDGV